MTTRLFREIKITFQRKKKELCVQSTEIKNDTLSVLNLEAVAEDGEPSNPTPK